MDSLNIDNRSKALAFKKFKRLLFKYYPKFVKTFKKHPHKFDIRQFLVFLYDCVTNIKYYCSIDRLLKNDNILQVGTGKNPTTPLYKDAKKSEIFFNVKNIKITKGDYALKVLQGLVMFKFQNLLTFNYNLKILNLQ